MGGLSREDNAALGACLVRIDQGMSKITQQIHQSMQRCTLAVESWTFDTSGVISRDWTTPYLSVALANHGAQDMTIMSGPARDVAPTTGPGIVLVKAGRAAAWNLYGTAITVYGTNLDRFTLSVFTREQPPAWA